MRALLHEPMEKREMWNKTLCLAGNHRLNSTCSSAAFSKPGSQDLEENSLGTDTREKQRYIMAAGSYTAQSPEDRKP